MFNVGDRVRCIRAPRPDRPGLAQPDELFTIRSSHNGWVQLLEKDRNHGTYSERDFVLVAARPIAVGDRVSLRENWNFRRAGTPYIVHGVKDNLLLINGSWTRADRFTLTPPATPPAPPARAYDIHTYPGCCGAMIVFFGGSTLDAARVKVTTDSLRYPGYVAVLNWTQYNAGGGKILEEAGWVLSFVTASNTSKTCPLYHYRFIRTEAALPSKKVSEAPRVFGK